MELWLKGYLGLFFNFLYFGNLNWLAIPLFIYFVISIKKRKRWEMALVFVFILSCVLVVMKLEGYPRYTLTLHPFTFAAILLFGWEFIKKKNHYLQIGILIVFTIIVFFNYYTFRNTYKYYWQNEIILLEDRFPHKTVEIINNIKDLNSDSSILYLSYKFLFYYHANKKGIDFRDPKMNIFYRQRDKEAALDILKNHLKVKYIFLQWNFNILNRNFEPDSNLKKIINNNCDLIIKDKQGNLYRIREKDDK